MLLIGAFTMVSLLTFSALVIDIGNARQVRRRAQNSADAAALAAAQDLPSATAVVATVKAYASENMGIASTAWIGCADPQALSVRPDTFNSNTCISIDAAFSRVRVKIPTRNVPTMFAGVIGMKSISVSALAVAEAQLRNDDRIIPAAVTASMGTGNLCIENSGNNQDCANRSSGNFGSLDSPRLNIYQPSSNEDPNSLRTNYAMSLDHEIRIYGGLTRICDGPVRTPCSATNVTPNLTANHMNVYTGNAVPPVTEGFIEGFTINTDDFGTVSFCGRLQRPDLDSSNVAVPRPNNCQPDAPTITVLGTTVNGRHIYYWMKDWAKQTFYPEVWAAESPVNRGMIPATNAIYATGDVRLECFIEGYRYDYGTGVETVPTCPGFTLPTLTHYYGMFGKDMPGDSRFGMIPVLAAWPSGGSNAAEVVGFWGEYTYHLYTTSTKLSAMDAWVFEPALIETESGVPGLQFGFQSDPVVRLVQ